MPLYPPSPTGGGLSDGDYGDITVSGGGAVLTIDPAVVTEAKQVLADNTTQDVSITKHGYAPKAPNDVTKFLNGLGAYSVPPAGGSDAVDIATPSDIAINSITDITIATHDVLNVVAGDQVILDAWFIILNNSTATRVYAITVDFDAAFDIEISTAALAFSSTLMHVFRVEAVCNVRSTSLSYMMVEVVGQLAAGIASGTDTTMAATHLHGKGWGTSAGNLTGTLTTVLKIRSAAATATQTCRLLHCSIRKVSPL